MGGLLRDMRFAFRQIRTNPEFATVAILTLRGQPTHRRVSYRSSDPDWSRADGDAGGALCLLFTGTPRHAGRAHGDAQQRVACQATDLEGTRNDPTEQH